MILNLRPYFYNDLKKKKGTTKCISEKIFFIIIGLKRFFFLVNAFSLPSDIDLHCIIS